MKKYFSGAIFLILCAFCSLPQTASAATVYINSATGDDSTGNGSSSTPYKTFHKGYSSSTTGDTLDLTGTFDWSNTLETGDSSNSGYTINKNLTIQGQGPTSTFVQASSSANSANRSVFTVASGRTVTIKNLGIRYGVSTSTSGLSAGGVTNNGTLTLQNVSVTNNKYDSTSYYGGGGVFSNDSTSLTITSSTIADNTFNGYLYGSGGVYTTQSVTLTITGTTFSGNTAIGSNPSQFPYSYAEPSGALGVFRFGTDKVTNSTFVNNTTNAYAGAIQVYYPGSFTITNSTIVNNSSSLGTGGILFESVTSGYNLYLRNSILGNNIGNNTSSDFYVVSGSGGMVTDNGHNIVEFSTNKTWSGTGNLTGNQSNLNVSSTLASNNSLYSPQTLALLSGSVAINAGTSTANNGVTIPGTDARGASRSGTVDIGAVEFNSSFDTIYYTLTYTAGTGGTISGSSTQSVVSGASGTAVTAIPNSEYVFSSWSDGSTSTSRTDLNVSSSISVTATFVFSNALAISNIATSTATSSATISWDTTHTASTQVHYGLTSSYGSSTAITDASPRVASHTVSLSNLVACTSYQFLASSTDALGTTVTSTNKTLTTEGCAGNSPVLGETATSTATSTGSTLSYTHNNSSSATLNIPSGYASQNAEFQIKALVSSTVETALGTPSSYEMVGSHVYDFKALTDTQTTISSFSSPITVTIHYLSSEASGLDETTLWIYRYDGSSWNALSSCSVNTNAKTVTCTTTQFSTFSLFGQATTSGGSSSGGSVFLVPSVYPQNQSTPIPSPITPPPTATANEISSSGTPTTSSVVTATSSSSQNILPKQTRQGTTPPHRGRDLTGGTNGKDVLALQKFLIEQNTGSRARELAQLGATGYFGKLTKTALAEYQKTYRISPAQGYFGWKTKIFLQSLY